MLPVATALPTIKPSDGSAPAVQLIAWRGPDSGNVIPRAQSLPKHLANILRQNDPRFLAGRGLWVSWGGLAVGFAVTRGRQISVRYRSTLHCCFSGDLPTRVDAVCVLKKRSITIVNEVVQLCHRAVLPKECAAAEGHIARISDDLAFVVDP